MQGELLLPVGISLFLIEISNARDGVENGDSLLFTCHGNIKFPKTMALQLFGRRLRCLPPIRFFFTAFQ